MHQVNYAGRVVAHLMLIGAMIGIIVTTNNLHDKDLTLHYVLKTDPTTPANSYYYPQQDKKTADAAVVAKGQGFSYKSANVFDGCRRDSHFLSDQERFSGPHDDRSKYHEYMSSTVQTFAIVSLVFLTIQAIMAVTMYWTGGFSGKGAFVSDTAGGGNSAVGSIFMWLYILTAVFVAATIGFFFTAIAMRTDCGASEDSMLEDFMPQDTPKDHDSTKFLTHLKETCWIYNRAVANGGTQDPATPVADISASIGFTKDGDSGEIGVPDTTRTFMWMMNCGELIYSDTATTGDQTVYLTPATNSFMTGAAAKTWTESTDKFPFTKSTITKTLDAMNSIHKGTQAVAYLTGFALILLAVHITQMVLNRRAVYAIDSWSSAWHGIFTFAWYSIAMGSLLIYLAMKEAVSHDGVEESYQWQLCSINPDAAAFKISQDKHHNLWANHEEENMFESNAKTAFIIAVIVLFLTWIYNGSLSRLGAVEARSKEEQKDVNVFVTDVTPWLMMIPAIQGILTIVTVVLALQPIVQYSATFCSAAPNAEQSRMASGNLLIAIGAATLVFLAQLYIQLPGVDGLLYAGTAGEPQMNNPHKVGLKSYWKGSGPVFSAAFNKGPLYTKLATNPA